MIRGTKRSYFLHIWGVSVVASLSSLQCILEWFNDQLEWIIYWAHGQFWPHSIGCVYHQASVHRTWFIPARVCMFSEVNLSAGSHLRSAAPVDVHTDGTVRSAATHEQMRSVIRLHHPDEVPTAVLENTGKQRETRKTLEKKNSDRQTHRLLLWEAF